MEEKKEDKWKWAKIGLALIVGILMISPAFKLGIFIGIIFVITLLWLFIFKSYLFAEKPYYILVVFGIPLIGWIINRVVGLATKTGFAFLKESDLLSIPVFILVWVIVFFATRKIHKTAKEFTIKIKSV